MDTQIHIGEQPTPSKLRASGWDDPCLTCDYKPPFGLWTSSKNEEDRSDWIDFCECEGFRIPYESWAAWELDVRADARLFEINTSRDLQQIRATYGLRENEYSSMSHGIVQRIDWERFAHNWDGIHLTSKGEFATRGFGVDLLNGWDCESTVWLNWVFSDVREVSIPIGEMAYEDAY